MLYVKCKNLAASAILPYVRNVQRSLKVPVYWYRKRSAHQRVLPDFLIIGAMKCGTSSLFEYLKLHPWVWADKKEICYFALNFAQGINWYRSHFPTDAYKKFANKILNKDLITGEACPYYLLNPHTPRRVYETIPQAKIIVILRNPVDRAHSHYYHNYNRRFETLSFEEAIEAEQERLQVEIEKLRGDEYYISYKHYTFSYLLKGEYVDQLINWMKFFPREQFLILKFEHFFSDPASNIKQVLAFLNLPDWELKKTWVHNQGSYPAMSETLRSRLSEYFAPHNRKLEEYLGMAFNWEI